ncbi:hypothetical protein D3C77_397840 [compost metagenome]
MSFDRSAGIEQLVRGRRYSAADPTNARQCRFDGFLTQAIKGLRGFVRLCSEVFEDVAAEVETDRLVEIRY